MIQGQGEAMVESVLAAAHFSLDSAVGIVLESRMHVEGKSADLGLDAPFL